MLYISFGSRDQQRIWYVGEPKPSVPENEIEEIQADGHELQALYTHIPSLPFTLSPVVRFPNPWATFIYMNFPRSS